jgi:multidrug efflux pump subunit AcrB
LLPENPDEQGVGGTLGVWLRKFERGFDRLKERYRRGLTTALNHRGLVIVCIVIMIGSSLLLMRGVGEDFFPYVDAGLIRLHVRVTPGIRLEESERQLDQVERIIRKIIPADELDVMTDHIGLPIYWALLFYQTDSIGPQDADLQIQLKPTHHPSLLYVERIRNAVARQMPGVAIYAQAADITSQVLNFGLSAPIDVQIQGRDATASYHIAQVLAAQMRLIPGAVDVRIPQVFDYPTLMVNVDRNKAIQLGISEASAAHSLLDSLASSTVVAPNNWLDWTNGVQYNVGVQTPQHVVSSIPEILKTPITPDLLSTNADPQFIANLASVKHFVTPVGITHDNVLRSIDVNCGVEGRDLGGVTADVQRQVAKLGQIPPGTLITIRGQSQAMREAFSDMAKGLVLAIVLVYLLMATNYQSWRDPLLIMMALPGAFAGVLWILVLTHTTLNVESLMGSIMAVGVATTNGNLLITFANEQMEKEGADPISAAIAAGAARLRPVLMTALAMILGMLPMSLALGAGGSQNAPLGRAVIGGLIAATFMTLVVIPVVYSWFASNRVSKLQRDAQIRRVLEQTEATKEARL